MEGRIIGCKLNVREIILPSIILPFTTTILAASQKTLQESSFSYSKLAASVILISDDNSVGDAMILTLS